MFAYVVLVGTAFNLYDGIRGKLQEELLGKILIKKTKFLSRQQGIRVI